MKLDQQKSKLDLHRQKSRLEMKKIELERSMSRLTEAHPTPVSSTEANEGPRDHEDVATDFLEIQNEQSILANQQALLTLVNKALERLAGGTYGLCQHCAQPIPAKRLDAIPWAERCVQCEAQLEQVYLNREEVYGAPQTFY